MRHIVLGKREGRLEFWYRTMVAFSLLAGEWLGGGVNGVSFRLSYYFLPVPFTCVILSWENRWSVFKE